MKKQIITLALLLATAAASAQDKILDKYSTMGDVSTTNVTRGMLDKLTDEQRSMLSDGIMRNFADKIQNIRLLTATAPKAAKKLSQNLPKQLLSDGYTEIASTNQGKAKIQVLQAKTNPNSIILVLADKSKTIVASVKGEFTE